MKEYDIGIVGSGPAALSAAIGLAQRNFNVIVFYRPEADSAKNTFGETLNASVIPILNELGLSSSFRELNLERVDGSISSWGMERSEKTPALLHPLGIGWVFQRRAFQTIFLERVTSLGAIICLDRIKWIEKLNKEWKIFLEDAEAVLAQVLIIATGRDNPDFAKSPHKVSLDKLVACIVTLEDSRSDLSNSIHLDSVRDGWFFSVKSDNKTRVLSYFTDGDLLRIRSRRSFLSMINHCLPNLPSISTAIQHIDLSKTKSFSLVSANSAFRPLFTTKGLLYCGDAAQTFDPLSSQGISSAIADGIETANFITQTDRRDKESLIEYERTRRSRYLEYLRNWHRIYSMEKRWSGNAFWQRRQRLQQLKTFVGSVSRQERIKVL